MYFLQKYKLKTISKKQTLGMTLTEVMIVSLVIVALIIIALSSLRTQIFKSTDARRKAETRRIGIAVEEYEKDHDCYPLPSLVTCNPGIGLRPYLDKVPCDPETGASYLYVHEDTSCPHWYKIYSSLQNENDPDFRVGLGPGAVYSYVYTSSNAPDESVVGGGGGGGTPSDFFGCVSGICVPIGWDANRPGPVCDPNFQNSSCYGMCSNPANECMSWN